MNDAGLLRNPRARRAAWSSLPGFLVCCFLVASAVAQPSINSKITSPRYTIAPGDNVVSNRAEVESDALAGTTIPLWTVTAIDGRSGKKYSLHLVGKSPLVKAASASVTIPAPVVALDLKFSNGATFRPETADGACGLGSSSAVKRVLGSPIYQKHSYTVGNTQYVDAFQRANFYAYTHPGGTSPGYHVLLSETAHFYFYSTPFSVPAADGVVAKGSCGPIAGVNISWLDNLIKKTILPGLSRQFGVGATNFPVILLYNVVICDSGGCGIGGYHGSYKNSAGHYQTYAVSMYQTRSGFGFTIRDIAALSHEVGEWMNDPLASTSLINLTPKWGHIGQVSGCQGNFEVGDPLSSHTLSVKMGNGVTYHPQELAYISWFYHFVPSIGLGGGYSDNGTFKGDAKACPPGGTN